MSTSSRWSLPHKAVSLPALLVYGVAVFAANWLIRNVGTVVLPDGTHLLPVGFGLVAPSGAYAAGVVFVARDVVQRTAGRSWSLVVILPGAALTAILDVRLALASASAFLLSELLDYFVYTRLQRRFGIAVGVSALIGGLLDSGWFLFILGILSWPVFLGLWLAKAYVAIVGGVVAAFLRRRLPLVRPPKPARRPAYVGSAQ